LNELAHDMQVLHLRRHDVKLDVKTNALSAMEKHLANDQNNNSVIKPSPKFNTSIIKPQSSSDVVKQSGVKLAFAAPGGKCYNCIFHNRTPNDVVLDAWVINCHRVKFYICEDCSLYLLTTMTTQPKNTVDFFDWWFPSYLIVHKSAKELSYHESFEMAGHTVAMIGNFKGDAKKQTELMTFWIFRTAEYFNVSAPAPVVWGPTEVPSNKQPTEVHAQMYAPWRWFDTNKEESIAQQFDPEYDLIKSVVEPIKPTKLDDWYNYLTKECSAISCLGIVTAGLALVYASYKAITKLSDAVYAQGTYDVGNKPVKAGKKTGVTRKDVVVQASDSGTRSVGHQISRNNVRLTAVGDKGDGMYLHGTGLYDRVLVCPKHFEIAMKLSPNIRIQNHRDVDVTVPTADIEYICLQDQDIMFMKLPDAFHYQFSHIKHHFPKNVEEVRDAVTNAVSLVWQDEKGNVEYQNCGRCDMLEDLTYTCQTQNDSVAYDVLEIPSTCFAACDGDCGFVWMTHNPRMSHKALGIHIAGSKKGDFSYCQIVFQDEIEIAEKKWMPKEAKAQMKKLGHSVMNVPFRMPEGLKYEIVVPEKQVRMPPKSQIVETLIYGEVIEPVRKPAVLAPVKRTIDGKTTTISPAELAIKKAVRPDIKMEPFEKSIMKEAMRIVIEDSIPQKVSGDALPLLAALNVPPGYKEVSPVYVDTSAGYPWNTMHMDKKHPFIEVSETGLRTPTDLLRKECSRLLDQLDKADPSLKFIFSDCLKDELRTVDRVEACKTRLFSGAPVEVLVTGRMLFLDLIENAMRSHNHTGFAMGVNPHGPEWKRLRDYIVKGSDYRKTHVQACDIECQDGSTINDMSQMFEDLINERYEKTDTAGPIDLCGN